MTGYLDVDLARAFNEGSDARLAGIHPQDNPYPHNNTGESFGDAHRNWERGWWHVQTEWGTESRELVRPLPTIKAPMAKEAVA
jgi:hypothetical protein